MKKLPLKFSQCAPMNGCALFVLAASNLFVSSGSASVIDWDGDTSTVWSQGDNWSGGVAPADDLTSDTARFNLSTYGGSTNEPDVGTTSILGIQIGSVNGNLTISGTELSLGAGGIVQDLGADFTIFDSGLSINVGDRNQSWTNNSVNNLSISGQITGSANITFDGTGKITLGNNSSSATFTGDVIISQGQLDVSGGVLDEDNAVYVAAGAALGIGNPGTSIAGLNDFGGAGGTIGMIVNNNRVLQLAGDSTYSFSGEIGNSLGSATGEIALTVGDGSSNTTQILSGENTYARSTIVKPGSVLNVRNSNALGLGDGTSASGLSIENGGTLQIQGDINIANEYTVVSGDGLSGGGGAGAIVNVSGDNTYGGQLGFGNVTTGTRITSQSGTLNLSYAGSVSVANGRSLYLGGAGDGIFAGSLDSGGSGRIVKDGTGTWTLTGAGSDALYGTYVEEGTLILDGSVSHSVTVSEDAILGGVGSAGEKVTFSEGSIFEFDFSKSGSFFAGTTVSIGSDVDLDFAGIASGYSVSDTITIISAGTSITGSFANLAEGAIITSGDFEFEANYGSDRLELTVLSIIPEPSTYGILIGLAVLTFSAILRPIHSRR
ncbi:MAG: beta strand repeat-containing protein [Puniceicoccales bacterium]